MSQRPESTNVHRLVVRPDRGVLAPEPVGPPASKRRTDLKTPGDGSFGGVGAPDPARAAREVDRWRIRALVEAGSERARLYGAMARASRRIELQVALAGTLVCLLALCLEAALAATQPAWSASALLAEFLALAGPLAVVARSAAPGASRPEVRAAAAAAQARCVALFGARLEALAGLDAADGERAGARLAFEALVAAVDGDLAAMLPDGSAVPRDGAGGPAR